MKLTMSRTKQILTDAIRHFMTDELRLRQYRCQVQFADNDVTEFVVDSREQYIPLPTLTVCFDEPETTNNGEANVTDDITVVIVDKNLSLLQQVVVLAHELKHVQEMWCKGETTEEAAHHFDYRGLWYALQIGLISLKKYQQIQKLSRGGDLGPCLVTLL